MWEGPTSPIEKRAEQAVFGLYLLGICAWSLLVGVKAYLYKRSLATCAAGPRPAAPKLPLEAQVFHMRKVSGAEPRGQPRGRDSEGGKEKGPVGRMPYECNLCGHVVAIKPFSDQY